MEESLRAGASVAVIARAHGVNANQVFHWRKLYREGRLETRPAEAQLVPVRIVEAKEEEAIAAVRPRFGAIHIELGRARLRVEGAVDPDTLRLILEQLGR